MSIADDKYLKLAQEVNMPDAVVAMNIYYMKTDFESPQAEADVLDACELWIEALYTTIDDHVSTLLSLGDLVVYEWDHIGTEWDNIGSRTPSVTFAAVTDMLPHGVAAMVRGYTTEARTIGRKYLPGLDEASQEDGEWTAATLVKLALFGAAWSASEEISSGNNLFAGVFSTKDTIVKLLTGIYVVLTNPAYQRRRRPGVGM